MALKLDDAGFSRENIVIIENSGARPGFEISCVLVVNQLVTKNKVQQGKMDV